MVLRLLAAVLFLALPSPAQSPAAPAAPTPGERLQWVWRGSVAPQNLAARAVTSGYSTVVNSPRKWDRSWAGFGKRFGTTEAEVTVSNSIEAGLGSLWGEDPRYVRAARGGFWRRTAHAAALSVAAFRPDGRLEPAYARYSGIVASGFLTNAWRPPGDNGWQDALRRSGWSALGRVATNVFTEFWPDIRRRLRGR